MTWSGRSGPGWPPQLDRSGLEVLDVPACLGLLQSCDGLGRLGLTQRALPVVLPVAFGLVDDDPVFRVGPGAVRSAAETSAVCCFEVDAAGTDWSWAWSVVVIGALELMRDPDLVERAGALGLPDWGSGTSWSPTYARLRSGLVSGRRHGLNPQDAVSPTA
jgi:hypothetical protein